MTAAPRLPRDRGRYCREYVVLPVYCRRKNSAKKRPGPGLNGPSPSPGPRGTQRRCANKMASKKRKLATHYEGIPRDGYEKHIFVGCKWLKMEEKRGGRKMGSCVLCTEHSAVAKTAALLRGCQWADEGGTRAGVPQLCSHFSFAAHRAAVAEEIKTGGPYAESLRRFFDENGDLLRTKPGSTPTPTPIGRFIETGAERLWRQGPYSHNTRSPHASLTLSLQRRQGPSPPCVCTHVFCRTARSPPAPLYGPTHPSTHQPTTNSHHRSGN